MKNKHEYIGYTLEDFEKLGLKFRIVRRDNRDYIVTRDFDRDRYNLYVENGIITNITFG